MYLKGHALFLLSAVVFFIIADAQDLWRLKTYDNFDGLVKSVMEELDKQISENREKSKVRDTLKKKQWDDSGIGMSVSELRNLARQYLDSQLPFGPLQSSSTEQTVTMDTKSASSSVVPSSSTARYSTVTPVTKKPTQTSKVKSSVVPSSSTAGYSTATPVTKKPTQTSTVKSSVVPSSSTADYSTATPVTKKPTRTTTAKSSVVPSNSTAGYSTATPVTKKPTRTSTAKSVVPSSSTTGYSPTISSTEEMVTSTEKSVESSIEPTDDGTYDPPTLKHPYRVGSIRGIPGEHFPDYTDIPITNFTCSDKPAVPGFYADLDAGCQVFHVCWYDRRETFLCPVGTTFNQAILACDYWYSNNCSLAPEYFSVNMGNTGLDTSKDKHESVTTMMDVLLESSSVEPSIVSTPKEKLETASSVISFVSKFLPVKAKVTIYTDSKGQHSEKVQTPADSGKQTSTYGSKLKAKDSASSSRPHTSVEYETTPEVSFKDFKKSLAEAFKQAYKHFEKLAQSSTPPAKDYRAIDFRNFVSGVIEDILKKHQIKFIPEESQSSAKVAPVTTLNPTNDPRLATVAPLTRLNPRFITKPLPIKPVRAGHKGHNVSVKKLNKRNP